MSHQHFTIEVYSAFVPDDWKAAVKMEGLNEAPIELSAKNAEELLLSAVEHMKKQTARFYNGPTGVPSLD